jgi:hypothetical protein
LSPVFQVVPARFDFRVASGVDPGFRRHSRAKQVPA